MINFIKGIVTGIGGIAPGLSGSVLLVIFGLYEKAIDAIATLFKNIKENLKFLIPLALGMGIGVIVFSKVVNYFIGAFEIQTRFLFFGLILGTLPLFYKQVTKKKEEFSKRCYILVAIAFAIGFFLFVVNSNAFPSITNPNILQSVILGMVVAAATIIPGVDSAAILSALGMYEIWVTSLANFNLQVLIPAGIGGVLGLFIFSMFMNKLIKKYHTYTFSVLFGLFIAIIPSVLKMSEGGYVPIGFNAQTLISLVFMLIGFVSSFLLGKLESKVDDEKEKKEKIKET